MNTKFSLFIIFICSSLAIFGSQSLTLSKGMKVKKVKDEFLFDQERGVQVISPFSSAGIRTVTVGEVNGLLPNINGEYLIKLDNLSSYRAFDKKPIPVNISGKYFTPAKEWIFLKDDFYTITRNFNEASYVLIPDLKVALNRLSRVALRGDGHKGWECSDNTFSANYTGLNCSNNRVISREFYSFLVDNFQKCIDQSLQILSLPTSKSLHIVHNGVVGDQDHINEGGSYHNIHRAMDIKTVTVKDTEGNTRIWIYEKGSMNFSSVETKFYKSFRQCWGRAHVERSAACRNMKIRFPYRGRNTYVASIGWEDPSQEHNIHLHVSYPFCPRKEGYFRL